MRISRRTFLKTAVMSAAVPVMGIPYAHYIEPDWIEVEQIELTLPRLSREFEGYRLALFSDLHIDSWLGEDRLADVIDRVNAEKPDAIAITGDFASDSVASPIDQQLVTHLSRLKPKDVTVAVLGNHDHWINARAVRQIITRSGLENICNKMISVQRGQARLHLAGVDDVWENKHHPGRSLRQLRRDDFAAILLAHEPDYADESARFGRFDLQISGHSHGGQVRIPGGGALYLPHLGKKYAAGKYQVKEMLVYTTRGVGMVPPLFRFNCRPEITLLTLRSPAFS